MDKINPIEEELINENRNLDKSYELLKKIIKSKKNKISVKDASLLHDIYHYSITTLMLLEFFTQKYIDWKEMIEFYNDKRDLSNS